MKRRARRVALICVGLVCLMLATLALVTWRAIRQERLNQALIAAVKRNDTRQLQRLITQGADVNAHDSARARLSLWRVFLNRLHGQRSEASRTSAALCVAIEHGCDTAIVQTLLDHGADPNAKDAEGQTALWVANDVSAMRYPPDVITPLLIRHHADVNILRPGSEGRTLLMEAAGWGDDADIDLLMHAGAHVNTENHDGETALIYAVDDCRPDNVDPLLKWRADPNTKARDGRTALMIAESNRAARTNTPFNHEDGGEGWREIVRLLKQAGAKK